MKNFHSFFDYWNTTQVSMNKSGRVMYGWKREYGGYPPKLTSIVTSKEKVVNFVDAIIGHQQKLPDALKHLFVANGIRYYSDFIKLIKDEPTKKL